MTGPVRALVLALLWSGSALANDYPTVDRVEYVETCMRERQGLRQELLYKCSCAIDAFAAGTAYDEYVELLIAARAVSIAGERGAVMREAADAQAMAQRFRALEAQARSRCFLD